MSFMTFSSGARDGSAKSPNAGVAFSLQHARRLPPSRPSLQRSRWRGDAMHYGADASGHVMTVTDLLPTRRRPRVCGALLGLRGSGGSNRGLRPATCPVRSPLQEVLSRRGLALSPLVTQQCPGPRTIP
jgi:hypothetical protein